MNRTPSMALDINCAALFAPIRISFSPDVSMKLSVLRIPTSCNIQPNNFPTVVLPVPGLPINKK